MDIDLKNNLKVSRQHALIAFNFQMQKFQIKCLSSKYPLKVNNIHYYAKDPPVVLEDLTNILIGNMVFYFLLPK